MRDRDGGLLKTLKEHEDPYVREKVLILINDGKTYQESSKFLNISYPTVAYWAGARLTR